MSNFFSKKKEKKRKTHQPSPSSSSSPPLPLATYTSTRKAIWLRDFVFLTVALEGLGLVRSSYQIQESAWEVVGAKRSRASTTTAYLLRSGDSDRISLTILHIGYWGIEFTEDFIYFALERCACSLYDLIQAFSAPDFCVSPGDSPSVVRYKSGLRYLGDTMQDVSLWTDGGRPSLLLLKLMRDVVLGLSHLHDLKLHHWNLKPKNILITGKPLVAKLTDMTVIGGTSRWQAPEILLGGLATPTNDMFSFGCVLFFCVTGGKHPFGSKHPDFNILKNDMDLSSVASIPEAHDLISRLLNPNPILRPMVPEVLQHPLLKNSEIRPSFFFFYARDRAVKIPHSTDAPKPAKEFGRFPALLMEVVSRFCKKDVLRKYIKFFK